MALHLSRRLRNFAGQLVRGEFNFKMLRYHIVEKLLGRWRLEGNDDFNWSRYTIHYEGELKLGSRTRTLAIEPGDYAFSDGRLIQRSSKLPLHPKVHTIYETILLLEAKSVLEVGCGGGDNLHNLQTLQPSLALRGIDVSAEQIELLKRRHPHLNGLVGFCDITNSVGHVPPADLVFTNAVLMHIGTKGGRWENAVRNLFRLAQHYIVLVEHWTKHEYVEPLKRLTPGQDIPWPALYLYTRASARRRHPKVLVASRYPLLYEPLYNSAQLISQ